MKSCRKPNDGSLQFYVAEKCCSENIPSDCLCIMQRTVVFLSKTVTVLVDSVSMSKLLNSSTKICISISPGL